MTQQEQQKVLYQIQRMVNSFSRIMKMKLHENMHKGTWNGCTYDYLRSRIDDEIAEFDHAIAEGRYQDAICEAGDVGNFFAMIADNIEFQRFKNYTRSRPAPASDEMAIIEQQKIHIKVLNEKMVEMMQGAAAQARDDVLEEILDHLEPYGLKSRGGIAQETIWTTGMLRAYIQSLRRSTTTAKERDTP